MYNVFMEQKIIDSFANSSPDSRLLLLDYDGTLTPLMELPEQAKPTRDLRKLLKVLSAKANIVVISGRDHNNLEEWLGDLPNLDFGAEHGLFLRQNGDAWQATRDTNQKWKESIRPLMLEMCQQIPGSLLEEADGTLNWHYRAAANEEIARIKAKELIKQLESVVTKLKLSMLDGSKVVTVKLGDVDKGRIAQHWLNMQKWEFILAAGDDTTDEFLFAAMPPNAYTVKIGKGETQARERISSVGNFVSLLEKLIKI